MKEFQESFTGKFNCNILVYYENFLNMGEAIAREKQFKKWKRAWKDELITKFNQNWNDLFDTL